jgi:hypothetical protein
MVCFLSFVLRLLLQEGPVVVVADRMNHRLALWHTNDYTVWKHLGTEGTEPGQFTYPSAVALTRAGALVVTDAHRVQVMTVDGDVLCVIGPNVTRIGSMLFGVTVCRNTDEILFTDWDNHRVVGVAWQMVRLEVVFQI